MSSSGRILRRFFSVNPIPKPDNARKLARNPTLKPDNARKLTEDLYNERNLEVVVQKFKKSCELPAFRRRRAILKDMIYRLASAGHFEWIEEILEEQKKYNDISKDGFCALLIRSYGKAGMVEQAYKAFDEMPNKGLLSFNALLGACVNAKKFDMVNGLFKEFTEKLSIEPNVGSYTNVMRAFCEMCSLDSALLMLDEMEKKGLQPDMVTFYTLLIGFYKNGRFADGEKIWVKMVEKNVEPHIKCYNSKLRALVTEKRMEEAVNFVEEMRSKGIEPDGMTFTHMINGYVNEGKLEEVKDWYNQIRKKFKTFSNRQLALLNFTILIPFLCEKGDLKLAIEVCKDIFEVKHLFVDDALFQRVVDELVKASMSEDAKKLVELGKARYILNMPKALKPGIARKLARNPTPKPDNARKLARNPTPKPENARKPLEMSSSARILRRIFSGNPIPKPGIARKHARNRTPKPGNARKLADDLYSEPNLEVIVQKLKKSIKLSGCYRQRIIAEDGIDRLASAGRFEWIEEILEEQKKYKHISEDGFCAFSIKLYGKAGMFEQAYKVFDEMPDKGLLSFTALIGACVNAKKFDKVNEFFKELPEKLSIEPDVACYNSVIKAFCEMGTLDSALLMLAEMEKKGLQPNAVTFNTLSIGFYNNGRYADGEKIWVTMVEKNVKPDLRCYNARLRALVTEKGMEEAVNFVEEMRSQGVQLDGVTFSLMINGYVNEGKLEEVKDWYYQLTKSNCGPQFLRFLNFSILVPFLCKKGDLKFAIELCNKIFKGKQLLVDDALLQRVVDELVKASMRKDAKKLVLLGKPLYNLKLRLQLEKPPHLKRLPSDWKILKL